MSDAQFTQQISGWLDSLPDSGRAAIASELLRRGLVPSPGALSPSTMLNVHGANGHSQQAAEPEEDEGPHNVLITRLAAEDLLVKQTPPYVDVFELIPLWKKLAFRQNVLIKGPKGNGKSLSLRTFCKTETIPMVSVECSEETKKSEFIGNFTKRGNDVIFVLGAIPTAIDVANECGACVLNFEELNATTPQMQKIINSVADFRKAISIPQIKKVYELKPGAKLWVSASMNPSVYGGTYDLNEDLKSRFEEVEIGYPPFAQEKHILKALTNGAVQDDIIDKVLRFAGETRQAATGYALSTRDLERLTINIATLGAQDALQLVACKFEGEDRNSVIPRITSHFAGIDIKRYWRAPA